MKQENGNKKLIWQIPLSFLGFLCLIALASFYKTLISESSYIENFDRILNGSFSGIWALINNPIVLTLISIIVLFVLGKEYIIMFLPAIDELKLGSISASFDMSRMFSSSIDANDTLQDIDNQALLSDEVKLAILGNVKVYLVEYFQKVAGKHISIHQHLEILKEILQKENLLETWSGKDIDIYVFGIIFGTVNFNGTLFDVEWGDDNNYSLMFSDVILDELNLVNFDDPQKSSFDNII